LYGAGKRLQRIKEKYRVILNLLLPIAHELYEKFSFSMCFLIKMGYFREGEERLQPFVRFTVMFNEEDALLKSLPKSASEGNLICKKHNSCRFGSEKHPKVWWWVLIVYCLSS